MNRLTKRNSKGVAYMIIADSLPKRDQELEGSKPILEGLYAMFQKLAEYEDLEEQGLLIKLPCKVGEVVYEANIGRKIVAVYKVTSVTIMTHSRNYGWELVEGIYSNILGFNEFALGKTVFTTQEEAEKALKERI